jgi:glycosyltransferase involved in cell wall biosynthesis
MTAEYELVNITVAIPTYNGATRLPEVFDLLQKQLQTEDITWEILVVDNNSTDYIQEVIAEFQAILPHLRWCRESKQGAAFARHRAFMEARGELVAFLDDDTIPDIHWVSAVAQFAKTHPQAGAYGSRVRADYAVQPPANFSRIACMLAITEMGNQPLLYGKDSRFLPSSAGLVVRKSVWQQYVPKEMILPGRIEGHMLASEDLEMLSYIQRGSPWEIWYNPAMEITHKIPAARLEQKYLIPCVRGIGLSSHVIRMIGTKGIKKYLLTLAHFGNDLKNILWHLFKYRTDVKTDLVATCELSLLTGRLISPFFLWRKGYLSKRKS